MVLEPAPSSFLALAAVQVNPLSPVQVLREYAELTPVLELIKVSDPWEKVIKVAELSKKHKIILVIILLDYWSVNIIQTTKPIN